MDRPQSPCPRCGAENSAEALVCPRCAADRPFDAGESPAEPRPIPEPPYSSEPDFPPAPTTAVTEQHFQHRTQTRSTRGSLPEHALPDLSRILPPGRIELDLDEVARAALEQPGYRGLEPRLEAAVAEQLGPGEAQAAGALAQHLVKLLEMQARFRGTTAEEELRELGAGQAVLEVRVEGDAARSRVEVRLRGQRSHTVTAPELPAGLRPEVARRLQQRPRGMGCGAGALALALGAGAAGMAGIIALF